MAKAKALLSGIATLLVAGILAGGVCAAGYASRDVNGGWFRESDIKAWTLKDKNKPTDTTEKTWGGVIDNVGNELNATTTYAMPAAMAFYSTSRAAMAEQLNLSAPSVTVTCSHNFEFNNVLVDWSVEYPSGASAADVITVTPTSDGSLTANVSCTAPAGFDSQLTLKATLRDKTKTTATCTIDYVKRINAVTETEIQGSDFGDEGGIQFGNMIFGNGTVNANLVLNTVKYNLIDSFKEAVQSYLKFNIEFDYYTAENLELKHNSSYYADDVEWEYSMFIYDFDNYDQAHKNAIYYAWLAAFTNDDFESIISIDFTIDLIYNGKKIDSYKEINYYSINPGSILSGDCYGYNLAPNLTLNGNLAF